jgi:predicted dehydrogenase
LRSGFNVVCDKPMTIELGQAEALVRLVERTKAVFAVTHNYTGYPMVRQAREMIAGGELGAIQAVRAHYIQGGLRAWAPGETPARGAWKGDPEKAGPAGALGDIGSHAFNLLRYVTGLRPTEVSCQLAAFSPGRRMDDYGHTLLRFADGAVGAIVFSQVTHGRLNDLALEVDGAEGSLTWRQEEPNQLALRRFGQPVRIYERNPRAAYLGTSARCGCRLPGGHPEGFLEAFANLYHDAFDAMAARARGRPFELRNTSYPNVYDGLEGVHFIQQCLASHGEDGSWQPLRPDLAREAGEAGHVQ